MSTIHEHEVMSSEGSQGEQELREHKVYKLHLAPAHFVDRAAGLASVKQFLLTLPLGEQSQWAFNEPASVEESSDVDTADQLLAKRDLGISLKLEKNTAERKKLLVLKIKGLDPVVVARHNFMCRSKKFALRQDLVFSWDKSVVSKSWKAKVKYNRDLVTFGQVYEMFAGLEEVLRIPGDARLVMTRTTAAFKLTCPSIGIRPAVRAQVAIHYPTENDALAGTASFASSLSLRIRKGNPAEWMETSRKLYHLFFSVMTSSKLSFKGPVLKTPTVQTALKLTREYALFLQASKFQNRDEAVQRFNEFLTLHGGFKSVDVSCTRDRVMEHFSLDTPQSTLKNTDSMQEAVIKFERNVDTRVASITCKYKGFDREIVSAFPVRVSELFQSSAKLELDVHPTFARNAISIVARVPFDMRLSCFADIEAIFPGFLVFSKIEPWQPVVVRMYKVKYEICKQILNLPCGKAAVGRMSLEYGSLEDARASKGICGGEWIYRLSENPGWEQGLHEAMQIFTHTLCRSPYNYEGPSSKPDQVRSAIPQLEDTTLPVQRTCGLIVLSREVEDAVNPWRVLLLRRAEVRQSLSGSKWDVPKGKMDSSDASELTAAFRELAEETGLNAQCVELVHGKDGPMRFVASRFPSGEDGKIVKKSFILFLGLLKDRANVVVSSEHAGFSWKPWDGRSEISLKSTMFETCLRGLRGFLPGSASE